MNLFAMFNPILAFSTANIGELGLILACVLILAGRNHLRDIRRGFRKGMTEFRNSTDEVGHDIGRNVAGIHGKPAAEALTIDNQTAEFYDLAILRKKEPGIGFVRYSVTRIFCWFRACGAFLCKAIAQIVRRMFRKKTA